MGLSNSPARAPDISGAESLGIMGDGTGRSEWPDRYPTMRSIGPRAGTSRTRPTAASERQAQAFPHHRSGGSPAVEASLRTSRSTSQQGGFRWANHHNRRAASE